MYLTDTENSLHFSSQTQALWALKVSLTDNHVQIGGERNGAFIEGMSCLFLGEDAVTANQQETIWSNWTNHASITQEQVL